MSMTATTPSVSKREWVLDANDRCDRCSAQAYVKVTGVSGDLLFCAHHYNNIMSTPEGYDKMMQFMYEILDERDRLSVEELKEEIEE
jgi:ribosomal protein L37E